jgi:predicted transcriptional regulator of viral defense system
MKKEVTTILELSNRFWTTQALEAQNVHAYQRCQLIDNQQIIKIKHGIYKSKLEGSESQEWADLKQIAPKGTICLLTAAVHYELTTFMPAYYQLAIPRKSKVVLPSYPPIHLYYWSEQAYQLGRQWIALDDALLPIYDLDKTVCDILKYRHKLGLDTCKEIVRNYLRSDDRNLIQLMNYAQKLNIYGVVDNFVQILL